MPLSSRYSSFLNASIRNLNQRRKTLPFFFPLSELFSPLPRRERAKVRVSFPFSGEGERAVGKTPQNIKNKNH